VFLDCLLALSGRNCLNKGNQYFEFARLLSADFAISLHGEARRYG
jgi:hypothetical protein